ncbi:MAG: alpha/beta hydrolase [Bacteroidetes bacterium]|nr:alpha/beta hydrolase [Bacteroidota bacterium]
MIKTQAQKETNLYQGEIPNSKPAENLEKQVTTDGILRISDISIPTYTVFQPAQKSAKKAAIIIFPGGGYTITASSHEGSDIAKSFNDVGITAILIKYRIPSDRTMQNREIGPLQDAQQAILTVREHAAEWDIDPTKIGIIGFSAGGHLASTLGTHYETSLIPNPLNTSLRPDFMILGYPVISFQDSIAHIGSRNNLIGKNPSKEKKDLYSNELQITKNTPTSFLFHASDDGAVKVNNSVLFYQSCIAHGVKAELHIYQNGGHGFGLKSPITKDYWMISCKDWLRNNNLL